ncbi:hypothetical protein UFOVP685_47 [uncultured Caudovirales phage]|uniref:Acb2/Tad1 hairpin domain-containing protein n=1 Tax=uncultured Caudovirales phage TaxID=2100421 RepID=A0A6J5N3A2_9CAUD|nr:hypothetical protein UFOVP590_37 [uncultured Caudovirales phage]CAB4157791.1 hypothetical protein UFOVP685_47 [uncultured Caudovirales phage]CAB5225301.1 hypothetical protein UFOVP750_5 [uncultured Caudovirales phage]
MSDTFRKKYSSNAALHEFAQELKSIAEKLEMKFKDVGQSREISLAMTNLEQSVMWAVKAIFNKNEGVQS